MKPKKAGRHFTTEMKRRAADALDADLVAAIYRVRQGHSEYRRITKALSAVDVKDNGIQINWVQDSIP